MRTVWKKKNLEKLLAPSERASLALTMICITETASAKVQRRDRFQFFKCYCHRKSFNANYRYRARS